jgi:hypothetical protein
MMSGEEFGYFAFWAKLYHVLVLRSLEMDRPHFERYWLRASSRDLLAGEIVFGLPYLIPMARYL